MSDVIQLHAILREVSYNPQIIKSLDIYTLDNLRKNQLNVRPCCKLIVGDDIYGLSQWLSPKRTRSYPYSRVYATLGIKNRLTIIPFCKDEGKDGDRDFIQWDTVSLMSLLNVHVIIGFYATAEKSTRPKQISKHKITNQIYDYNYIYQKIIELQKYQSSPLHWNLKQIEELLDIADQTLKQYKKISKSTKVLMHGEEGIKKRIKILNEDVQKFKNFSRKLAGSAQYRENLTTQPKEKVIGSKVSITMNNLLGGVYYMTADEGVQCGNNFFLIEKKHSQRQELPSLDDIKDAFIKMILYYKY